MKTPLFAAAPRRAAKRLLTTVLLLVCAASAAQAAPETARQADAFVDTIGVNVHLGYNTLYSNYDGVVKPRLQELGIRHIRDGCLPSRSDVTDKLQDLHDTLGIKSLLICGPNSTATAVANRDFIKNVLGVGRVAGVEGINEPNGFLARDDPNWAQTTRDYQRDLWNAFTSEPATTNIPLCGPSLTNTAAANELGSLSAYLDYGNIHNYYGGRNPETAGWGSNGYGSVTWSFNYMAAPVSGSKAVWATETGWHNALSTTSGHRATPEGVVAKYMPRLFLYHFNRGIVRSYPYELLDQGTDPANIEHNFGLVRNNNSVKPAFTALKNLIALLKDPGTGFTPGALDYTLSGSTANVQRTLVQKRDGTFYLALWVGTQNWNPDTKVETPAANQSVTLTLATPISAAATCRPNDNTTWAGATISNNAVGLTLNDKVLLVRLTRATSTSYEAENAALAGGAVVASDAAASGGKKVGQMHNAGASLTISGVNGGQGGSRTLVIRYATTLAPLKSLYVNGVKVRQLSFPATGGWSAYRDLSTTITLNAGTGNTVRIVHEAGDRDGCDLDRFTVR